MANAAQPVAAAAAHRTDAAAVMALPKPAELQFDVSGRVSGIRYNASAQLHWQHDGLRYQAEQSIRAPIVGTRSQKSQGVVADRYLQPLSFEDSSRKRRNIRFDPTGHTATAVESGDLLNVPAGAQDRLSVFFQLAATIAANEQLRGVGQRIPIWTVASNKQEAWVFEVKDTEAIELPAGTLPAIKLQRLPRKPGDDQLAEIWLSPQTGYLPVRIHFEDEGDAVDLKLTRHIAKPLTEATALRPTQVSAQR